MAKDKNTDFSTEEFIDALERGQRLYKGFESGLEVARRIANIEQAERDLLQRVASAKVRCEQAGQDSERQCAEYARLASEAQGQAEAILSRAKDDAADMIRKALATSAADVAKAKEAERMATAAMRKNQDTADDLSRAIAARHEELRKINKQLDDARAAKKALLEA